MLFCNNLCNFVISLYYFVKLKLNFIKKNKNRKLVTFKKCHFNALNGVYFSTKKA